MVPPGPPPPPVSRFTSTTPPQSPAELISLVSNYLFDVAIYAVPVVGAIGSLWA